MEILSSPRRGRRGNLSGFGTNKLGTLIFGSKVELGFRGQILLQFGEDLVKEATVLGKIHRGIISKVKLLNQFEVFDQFEVFVCAWSYLFFLAENSSVYPCSFLLSHASNYGGENRSLFFKRGSPLSQNTKF